MPYRRLLLALGAGLRAATHAAAGAAEDSSEAVDKASQNSAGEADHVAEDAHGVVELLACRRREWTCQSKCIIDGQAERRVASDQMPT